MFQISAEGLSGVRRSAPGSPLESSHPRDSRQTPLASIERLLAEQDRVMEQIDALDAQIQSLLNNISSSRPTLQAA